MEAGINWINAQRHKLGLSRSERQEKKKILKVRKDMTKVSVKSIKVDLDVI